MPYIKNRDEFENRIRDIGLFSVGIECNNSGELNYSITSILHGYIKEHDLCYKNLNEVVGALECAKQEFYRTVVAPYEDIKRRENGSISELDKEKSDG